MAVTDSAVLEQAVDPLEVAVGLRHGQMDVGEERACSPACTSWTAGARRSLCAGRRQDDDDPDDDDRDADRDDDGGQRPVIETTEPTRLTGVTVVLRRMRSATSSSKPWPDGS